MADNVYFIHEENLTCAICLDCWVDKDPRELPCQHTFCFNCLEKLPLKDFNLICPICTTDVYLPTADISSLKKNLLHSNIYKNKNEKICEIHKTKGTFFCTDHNVENICDNCLDEEHFQCKIITMRKKEDLKRKKLEEWFKEDDEIKLNLTKILQEKESDLIKNVKKEFLKLNQELNSILENRKKDLLKQFDSKNVMSLLNLNTNNVLQKNLYLKTEKQSFQTGIKICQNCFPNDDINDYKENYNYKSFYLNCLKIYLDFSSEKQINESKTIKNINIQKYEDLLNEKPVRTFKLTQIDQKTMEFLLNQENTLKSIDITATRLDKSYLSDLSIFFSQQHHLTNLNLSGIRTIGSFKHKIFQNLEKTASFLVNFKLSNCDLNEENVKGLSDLFNSCCNLKTIDLGVNYKVGTSEHGIFNNLIKSSSSLENIDLYEIDLNESNAKELSKLFFHCSNLKSINLNGNEIVGTSEHGIFNNLIKSSSSLENIDLYEIDLNESNAKELSKLFFHCSNLRLIDLSENEIVGTSEHGMFKNLIKSSLSIENIHLVNINLNESNAKELFDLEAFCPKLKIEFEQFY